MDRAAASFVAVLLAASASSGVALHLQLPPATTPVESTTEASSWFTISPTSACEGNNEGIKHTFGGYGFSLQLCKNKCTGKCQAIDYYAATGWCSTFDVACSNPERTKNGASSYRKAAAHFDDDCMVDGKSRRIAFLHVPKTGTSLGNMIAHYINSSLPEDAKVPDCRKETCSHTNLLSQGQLEFQYRYPADVWFRKCLWMKDGHGPGDKDWFEHSEVEESAYDQFKGRFVALFRDPRQRAVSSYYSFSELRSKKYKIQSREGWARRIEGTAVKMLTGQSFPIEARPGHVVPVEHMPKPNLELALKRLEEGFLFVGIVERFALSVCLFHTMTKTPCLAHDLDNMRKNHRRKDDQLWGTAGLNGYKDPYDTPLYEKAKERFWNDVERFGLSADSCQKRCPWMDKSDFDVQRNLRE